MERGKYLAPYRSKKTRVKFQGETTYYVTNFTPPTAKPGDTLYVDFPRIKDELVVPGSFALTFDFEVILDPAEPENEVNTYPVNNLAANIISDISIKIGSQPIFELDYAYLYNTYKDLWLSAQERDNKAYNGIQILNLRKLRTDINTTLTPIPSHNTDLKIIYGKRYKIPIQFEIINDHMPLSGVLLESSLTFEMRINSKKNVLSYKSETANFEMKNICLEYETIREPVLYKEIERDLVGGTVFLFDHVHHYKKEEVLKAATFVNVEIQGIDRESLKGILMLFENEFTAGLRDSEQFANPLIKNVKYTIGDLPNRHYNNGLKEWDQFDQISKHFVAEESKYSQNCFMNLAYYYCLDKYALWTDLRSTQDNSLHGSGKQHDAKNSIRMELTKTNNGGGKYIMHIFIVSDARILIKNKMLEKLKY
jgi:hypothetical protein